MGYVNEWGMAMGYWSATPLGTSWGMVWNLPQICPTVRVEMLGGGMYLPTLVCHQLRAVPRGTDSPVLLGCSVYTPSKITQQEKAPSGRAAGSWG